MTEDRAEVLVVGAGPSGSVLARELATAGRDVLVLERTTFPRDKPCGDFVNPGAVAELERLGLRASLDRRLAPVQLAGWRIEAPDGSVLRGDYASGSTVDPPQGWAVRRRDLDAALLDEARIGGARIRFGPRVFDLVRQGGRVVGVVAREGTSRRTFTARVVVGADGLRSVVRARAGLDGREPRTRKLALVCHLAGGNGAERWGEMRMRAGRVAGYAPVRGGANVTLVVPVSQASAISGDVRGYTRAGLAAFPEIRERIRDRGLEERVLVTGPFDRPALRPWGPGVLLVGDASGYYDPFTGQGIFQALRSARLAARAIEDVLDHPGAEGRIFARYGRALRRLLGPSRLVQRAVDGVIRGGAAGWFVSRLSRDAGRPATRLLRVTGDLDDAWSLLAPGFWAPLLAGGDERLE